MTTASHSLTQPLDPFYGHEDASRMAAAYVVHLFGRNARAATATPSEPAEPPAPHFAKFIAFILHGTRPVVLTTALLFLLRLKARYPNSHLQYRQSRHRLFFAAYVIASNEIYDDADCISTWHPLGQGLFGGEEIRMMVREMCQYLNWDLRRDADELDELCSRLHFFLPAARRARGLNV
ncbi:hypothetical protein BKA62DRAFT_678482 [Auriculariales sp. MPI-PUGE-AT-0066]|nr:hypothetical protein BKA62DRAFT_678482 [Auriculariales sp. MPI-PUGE-AT-0066]